MTEPDKTGMHVEELESGLVVVTDETALKAERKAKGALTKERRRKRLEARTAAHKGRAAWMPRAKRINRLTRQIERMHTPGLNGRKGAKLILKTEKELIEKIAAVPDPTKG